MGKRFNRVFPYVSSAPLHLAILPYRVRSRYNLYAVFTIVIKRTHPVPPPLTFTPHRSRREQNLKEIPKLNSAFQRFNTQACVYETSLDNVKQMGRKGTGSKTGKEPREARSRPGDSRGRDLCSSPTFVSHRKSAPLRCEPLGNPQTSLAGTCLYPIDRLPLLLPFFSSFSLEKEASSFCIFLSCVEPWCARRRRARAALLTAGIVGTILSDMNSQRGSQRARSCRRTNTHRT